MTSPLEPVGNALKSHAPTSRHVEMLFDSRSASNEIDASDLARANRQQVARRGGVLTTW